MFFFDKVILFPCIGTSTYTAYKGKKFDHVEEHSNLIKSALLTTSQILAKLRYFREKCTLLLLICVSI